MNGRPQVMLVLVLVASAALILAVMLWPAATPRTAPTDDPDESEVTVSAPKKDSGKFGGAALDTMRARAKKESPDGGAATVDSNTRVLGQFGWGSGQNQLGKSRPKEGNPEAPMAVALDAKGGAWVLDQVNGRMVKLDERGKQSGETPLPVQHAQDLAIAKNGTAAVLDRLVDKSVALIGADGKPVGELKLAGRGIEEPSKVTGVFVDGDSVYAEREHGDLVRLGDTKGKADADRPETPGRPSRDGSSYLTANISDGARGRVAVTVIDRASGQHRYTREIGFGMPVMTLLLLDSDLTGLLYLAALGERVPAGTAQEAVAVVDLLCLDPLDGRPLGRAELPANTSADETFREMTVLDSGGVLYLYRTDTGAELRRVDCR